MNRIQPILALLLIAIGVIGLIAIGCSAAATSVSFNSPQGFGPQGFGMMGSGMTLAPHASVGVGGPNGMMGGGMMGGRGYGYAPNVNATPVPTNRPIDREIKITARNLQFDPARVVVKTGETVRFVIANQDAVAHNFVSQDGNIAYTFLPAGATQSVVWVAPEKGVYIALCTFHAGMQVQVVVE